MSTQVDAMVRTYHELISLPSFEERYEYLKLIGKVGAETFGYDRYLNQVLYRSSEWKRIRDKVIIRDDGCDLACPDRQIYGRVIIHHMNPLSKKDIVDKTDLLFNPEYLICVSHATHNAIHYGDVSQISKDPVERKPNDTCPWR